MGKSFSTISTDDPEGGGNMRDGFMLDEVEISYVIESSASLYNYLFNIWEFPSASFSESSEYGELFDYFVYNYETYVGDYPTPENEPDPCAQAVKLENNASFKSEMDNLKSKTSENYEAGYVKVAGHESEYRTGPAGTIDWNAPQPSELADKSLEYISHSHHDDPNNLSIFSGDDLNAFSQYIHADKVVDKNSFTLSVTTADGTSYALILEDAAKFDTFYENYISDPTGPLAKTLNDSFTAGITGDKSISENESTFMNILRYTNSGISLLKANSDFTDWEKVTYDSDSGTTSTINCN